MIARRAWLTESGWALAAGGVATIVAACVLELWNAPPSQPIGYASDSLYYEGVVKGTIENGWYLNNPHLGAPFGLDSHDFPVVSNDALQLVIVKVLGLFFTSAFTVTNAFLLLTFPLAAITAYAAIRHLGGAREPALVAAVLFAALPFHFLRLTDQLFFSSYYLVPISCALVLKVLGGEPIFTPSTDRQGTRRWLNRRTLAVLVVCAAIASASIYYAVFTCVLVAAAALLRALAARNRAGLATCAVIVATIGAVAVTLQAPTVLYRQAHGENTEVAHRTGADTEFFALKLDQLVFPVYGHRIDALARFTDRYRAQTRMLGEPSIYLGAVGTFGLAWLTLVGLGSVVRAPGGRPIGLPRERQAAALTLTAFVVATAGGLSAVIGYALTSQIRVWGRMGIFIAFFALLALALLLGRLLDRAHTPGRRRVVVAGLAALLVFGAVEQTSPRNTPDHARINSVSDSDAAFVHAIERRLGPGAMVLQLPYAPYPENPGFWGNGDYEHMRGYMHSERLKWSYGAMKGRPADWQAQLDYAPLESLVAGAAAAGFDGIWIAREAYPDQGTALENALTEQVGGPVMASARGDVSFFDLRAYARRFADRRGRGMADATVRPTRVEYGDGFYGPEGAGADRWRWGQRRARIELTNPGTRARSIMLDVLVRTDAASPGSAVLRFPDGTTQTARTDFEGTRVRRTFSAPPGISHITVDAAGERAADPTRELIFQLRRPVFLPAELCLPQRAQEAASCTDRERPHLR